MEIMVASLYSAANLSGSSVSPGLTWVKRTGSSVISRPPAVCRTTVKRELGKSPGSGKSERKCAPREFSRFLAANAITRLTSMSERRLSQSCQVILKARPASARPVANSSASMASSAAMARSRPAWSRTTPTSSHMVSSSRSRRSFKLPPLRVNGWSARASSTSSTCSSGARWPGLAAIQRGITSPAMPPNTVELATPLPPRRLAPCMPLASSPATNSPGQSVVVSTRQMTPPNEVMRGGHHLDEAAGEIEAAVAAAIHHALELLRHLGRPEMAHLDVDAAVRARAPGLHLRVDGAADDVAGGALEGLVVAHEAVHCAV